MSAAGAVLELPREVVRRVALHGVVGVAVRRAAAAGDPQAMLTVDPGTRADPGPVLEQLRVAGPVVRTQVSYITVDHATAAAVLRDDAFRTVTMGGMLPAPLRWLERHTRTGSVHPLLPPSLLVIDPPEHSRYRTLVSSVFTARAVAALREGVQRRADELLDALAARVRSGSAAPVDLVEAYCARLPVAVISDILGVPEADRDQVFAFGEGAAPVLDMALGWGVFRRAERSQVGFDRWLAAHVARLRAHPGDDLLSRLTTATVDGERLSEPDLRATAGLVLAAGFETTVNLLSNAVALLLQHPQQLARLQADPGGWSGAVEEVLRFDPPVQLTGRVARHDVELGSTRVPAGAMVIASIAGAGRDPAVFDDPHTFDVGRVGANRHLAFSAGRHFCLGAALARTEGDVGLRSLFTRFPDLAAAGPGTRRGTRVLHGWATLPVHLAPPSRVAPASIDG